MQIGQLARHADVSIDTVRYYERNGILPKPDRQASGYRRYADHRPILAALAEEST